MQWVTGYPIIAENHAAPLEQEVRVSAVKLKIYVEVVLDSSDENKYMKHRTFTAQYKSLIYPNSGRWKLPVRLEKLSYGYSPFVFPETQMQQNCTVDLIPNRNGTRSTQKI